MLINRLRALEYMRRYNLDALLATSPANVTYFTGYFFWLDSLMKEYMLVPGSSSQRAFPTYALLTTEGQTTLLIEARCALDAADLSNTEVLLYGDPGALGGEQVVGPAANQYDRLLGVDRRETTALKAVGRLLSEQGLSASRIGVEREGLTNGFWEALQQAQPRASVLDCTNLIRLVRMVKTQDETDRLARAAEIGEKAIAVTMALAEYRRSTLELRDVFRGAVANLGADLDHFAFSIRGLGMATESDHILRSDDVLFVDFGCIYRHYFCDSGLTLAVGEMPQRLATAYEHVRASVDAGSKALRPGVKASEVHKALVEPLIEVGLPPHGAHGHGLGVEVRDYPIVVADNGLRIRDDCVNEEADVVLEDGMVLNLESPLHLAGIGSVHVEQTFLVTAAGAKSLVTQDRSEPQAPRRVAPPS